MGLASLNERASSAVLKKHLFKDQVRFIAVNVNSVYPSEETVEKVKRTFPHLQHFWMDPSGALALKIQFVPNRLILTDKGRVAKWWDGSHGKVVGGRHGKSRDNGSNEFTDIIADLISSQKSKGK